MSKVQRYENYINGQWVAGADYCVNLNPSELSDVIGEYAKADVAQVNAAIDAARARAAGIVTGDIAPMSRNGVITTGCPRRASRIAPSSIG